MTNEELGAMLLHMRDMERFPGICGRLHPDPLSWDADSMELTAAFDTDADMANPLGNLHGGMIAAIFDHGLGMIGACFARGAFTPTVALNIEYLRPTPVGGKLYVHAKVMKAGRSLIHVRGELLDTPESKKPCAAATAAYAIHRTERLERK